VLSKEERFEWYVIATMVFAAACGRAASVGGNQRSVPAEAFKIDDVVDISAVDSHLIVQYRTRKSLGDCKAQAAEMPEVWKLVVKPRLSDSPVQHVSLSPEDASGQSVAMTFVKSASGQWSTKAPCTISIPASYFAVKK
jgi:hypothetical protein